MRKLLQETGLPLGWISPDTSNVVGLQAFARDFSFRGEVDRHDGTMKARIDPQILKAVQPVFGPLPEENGKLKKVLGGKLELEK